MLDRGAGAFRIGPYDEMVPAARRYLPGSLMVETTWQTRTGWLIVRDALCMGPWHNVDERSRTHRRSPTDFDAEHCLLRHGAVRQRLGRPVDDLRTGLRLRPARADLDVRRCRLRRGRGDGAGRRRRQRSASRPTCGPASRARGLHARTRMVEGDVHFVALSWSPLPPPRTLDEAIGADAPHLGVLAAVDHPGRLPRPPVAQLPAAQRA